MRRFFLMATVLFWPVASQAQQLGIYGPSYPIAEPDMIAEIKSRIQKTMESGEFDTLKTEAQDRVRRNFQEPPPVPGISRTDEPRVSYFDPSIRVAKAIRGPNGRVIVPAGTVVNPLDYSPFTGKWIFIDGRDKAQQAWAVRQMALDAAVQPILVAGRWLDLWRLWGRRVYFDQSGAIVSKLGITSVPAVVTQDADGKRIRIDEVLP